MKMIAEIVEDIHEELDGADHYAKLATQFKDTDHRLADNYATMSAQELGHGNELSATVDKMMDKAKAEENPCYATLAMVWHHVKKRQAGYAAWILTMHDQYKK